MRHSASSRKSRNRGNSGNRRGNQNRVQVFDSNGPDVRIRGTAHQIHEKYIALAKDASSSGDYVLAESYLQHAEHYQRIITNWDETLRNGGRVTQPETQQATGEKDVVDEVQVDKKQDVSDDLSLPESIVGKKQEVHKKDEKNLEEA